MIIASVQFHNSIQVAAQNGATFAIGPGLLNGVLHIQGFDDVSRGIGKESGILRLTFGFGDKDGVGYVYFCLLSPRSLFPADGVVVRKPDERFKTHVTIQTVLETCGMRPFVAEPGTKMWLGHRHNKYCDLSFRLAETPAGLAVQLRAYVIEDEPHFADYRTVQYNLPLDGLLWRKAPRMAPDEILPEAEDYVSISKTRVPLVAGVTPSPIVVEGID